MQNKELMMAVASALMISAAPAMAAASDTLFNDVPTDHWAYGAVEQLAKDGILTGYSDKSFQGDKTITRYEMAQIVANARTHMQKADAPDQELIDKLSDEFRDDLDALGVRVTRLEKKQENVRVTGSFAQEYERAKHEGITNSDGSTVSPHWRKELKLNLDADVPKTALTFHGTFTTQMDSYKGSGFNTEEAEDETWNGGHERSNVMRPETYYVGGPIDKTGLDGKFGAFYTGVQSDFVNHAVLRGFDVSHQDKKNWFSVFTGRLDVKDSDTSDSVTEGSADYQFSTADIDWGTAQKISQTSDEYKQSYNVIADAVAKAAASASSAAASTDFLRHHKSASGATNAALDTSKTYTIIQSAKGTNWNYDWNNPSYDYSNAKYSLSGKSVAATTTRRRTLTGAAFGHRFTDRLDAEVGYYDYTSAAYDEDALRIYSLAANQKLGRKGNLYAAYAHGNQGGYNQAWTAEYQYNGGANMSADPSHAFGYYLGYRYLAPDALVKTVYEDGAQIGQRGWEGGLVYNFCHNLQGVVKYFNGSSITNPGNDRSKWFSSLTYNF